MACLAAPRRGLLNLFVMVCICLWPVLSQELQIYLSSSAPDHSEDGTDILHGGAHATRCPPICLLAKVHLQKLMSGCIYGLQPTFPRHFACADAPLHDEYIHDPIEGSSLLSLRELKVLKANWWNIYFKPVVASSGKSVFAELALTELNASTWQHADHKVINKFKLLHAALRGGTQSSPHADLQYIANCGNMW